LAGYIKNNIFKVISLLIRLPEYMIDLITLSPMAKQQRILDAVRNYGKRMATAIQATVGKATI